MKLSRRLALPLLFVLAAATCLKAQEAPTPVGRLSIASLDAVNKLITDLGIPGLPNLQQKLESAPFLGAATLDATKPLGLVVMASNGQPLLTPDSVIGVLPAAEGKATVADITAKGFKAVEGQTDTLSGQGLTVRRSAGYLLLKQGDNPAGLSVVTDDVFTSDYKTPGNVAVLSLNFKTLRDSAPNAYKQLLAAPALLGIALPASNPFEEALNKLDRYTLALAQDEKNIHIKSWTTPYPSKAAKTAPRPNFPAGTIFQMHMIYPDADAAGALDRIIDGISDETFNAPPGMAPRIKALIKRVGKINSAADAVSIAMSVKDGKPVFYVVSQLNQDYDFAAEIKPINDELTALNKVMAPTETLTTDVSTYDASGKKVQRVKYAGAKPDEQIFADVIQDGKTLYLAIATDDGKYVEDLANAKMGATSNLLCAGAIDLTALLKAASAGGGPMASMPPNMVQDLQAAFANQGITWTVQIADAGNYLYTDVQVPTVVIQQVIKLTLHSGEATPAAVHPAEATPAAVQP